MRDGPGRAGTPGTSVDRGFSAPDLSGGWGWQEGEELSWTGREGGHVPLRLGVLDRPFSTKDSVHDQTSTCRGKSTPAEVELSDEFSPTVPCIEAVELKEIDDTLYSLQTT